ncbi:thiol reductant ABC exporter subunit CydC [Roseburia sp. AM51-8]|uniref:thiol reductant ABC exporter subunit CydC n=1 Tax=Roseburia sp. AM51-8 TaxID=2292366 RepID=UPI000E487867|nr:thiol reductant ABC exporter subunit CydC [Roseburia sp. AM51-8]RHP99576.1 thiol reductant ABC exporter subunit CydC [Roseburia sp. AM51-8]
MKKRSNLEIMAKLIGMVRPLLGYMLLAITLGLIGHLLASFITIFAGYAALKVWGFPIAHSFAFFFVCMVVFAIARGFARYTEQSCNHYIAFKLLALIRAKAFAALRRLCPAKLEGRDKGDLISVITSDIELLEVFYAHTISPIAIATIYSVILSLFIGHIHWGLGLLALAAYVTVGVIVPVIASKTSGDLGLEFRNQSGSLSAFVLDSLRGLPETMQYGNGKKRMQQMNERTDRMNDCQEKMKRVTGLNMAVTNTAILVFDFLMLLSASYLYKEGIIAFDGIVIATLALMSSFGPVVALANLGTTLQNTFASGNRVLDILEEEPQVAEITGADQTTYGQVTIEDVTFAYEKETILDGVSLDVPKQGILGIVGKSGSGKSTLLKLLMRFWDVDSGKLAIADREIGKINTEDLRRMQGYMIQETHLFCDSIAENIRIAKLDATREEIEEACKKASIHDFILSLPQGYDTPVGELGDTLSGGERQRIGLARAFLHDAPMMLLDEPTSNLDSLNESVILRSLREERGDKLILLVSHRDSTMRIADQVYQMKEGRVS